jgi:hypothetical protein
MRGQVAPQPQDAISQVAADSPQRRMAAPLQAALDMRERLRPGGGRARGRDQVPRAPMIRWAHYAVSCDSAWSNRDQ